MPNLPRVTSVLEYFGVIDKRWYNTEACSRGRYVHQACGYIALGKEIPRDWWERHPEVWEYVHAFSKGLALLSARPLGVEVPVTLCAERVIGHADIALTAPGIGVVPLELKSGGDCPWVGLQTAAYAIGFGTVHRYTMQLRPNGKPKMVRLDRYQDFDEFRTYARALWALRNRGVIDDAGWQQLCRSEQAAIEDRDGSN